MPNCPKCDADIKHLKDYAFGATIVYIFSVSEEGRAHYSFKRDIIEGTKDEFECPECTAVLFKNEEEALAFLKGESIEREEVAASAQVP